MHHVTIRKATDKETEEALAISFYAFHPTPGSLEKHLKQLPYFRETTNYILYENKKPASLIACKPLTQNVRNSIKPMCGIANVASNPEVRRKGYIKQLMDTAFTHMQENHQIFSTLYPFKEAYYEKFGYVTFPQYRVGVCTPQSLGLLLNRDLGGTVRRMTMTEGFEIFTTYLREMQKSHHGMGLLPVSELERLKDESPFWLAVAYEEDTPIGILTYKITGFWKEMRARDFYYSNTKGKYLLLQWMAKHVDQIRKIFIPIKPDEYPDLWVTDAFWGEVGQVRTREWAPNPMGRVVQVDGLSGLQVGSGCISLTIHDDQCSWNNHTFKFEAKNGILQVTKTHDSEGELSIAGLSAIIYGCYNLEDFDHKRWGSLSEDVKTRIPHLFPFALPFLHADF